MFLSIFINFRNTTSYFPASQGKRNLPKKQVTSAHEVRNDFNQDYNILKHSIFMGWRVIIQQIKSTIQL